MNIAIELDRITQPTAASSVRRLSREEIETLHPYGEVTPLEHVLAKRCEGRLCCPANWGRGCYGFGR